MEIHNNEIVASYVFLRSILWVTPCTKTKIWDVQEAPQFVPAKEAYRGKIFSKAKAFFTKHNLPYVILSGLYGLIDPDLPIENYNLTTKVKKLPLTLLKEQAFSCKQNYFFSLVVALGGKGYTFILPEVFQGVQVFQPLAGLRIGEMLHVLSHHDELIQLVKNEMELSKSL